jgi:hypothetical protein
MKVLIVFPRSWAEYPPNDPQPYFSTELAEMVDELNDEHPTFNIERAFIGTLEEKSRTAARFEVLDGGGVLPVFPETHPAPGEPFDIGAIEALLGPVKRLADEYERRYIS